MKFKLYTLADITESRARKGDNSLEVKQQQNFLTVLQTIGLRVNPEYSFPPELINDLPKKYNLGAKYKTKQNIWVFNFDIEYEDALSIDMLVNDFNLIPFISNLTETAKFDNAQFITKDPEACNIYFDLGDK